MGSEKPCFSAEKTNHVHHVILKYSDRNDRLFLIEAKFSGFYIPAAWFTAGSDMPKCFSPELEGSGGALTVLMSGFFSGEEFSLCCCCWPPLLKVCTRGDVTLLLDRPNCPFFVSGDVTSEAAEPWSLLWVSREALFAFDMCGFSWCLTPCDVCVLVEDPSAAENDPSPLSAWGLNVDDCSEPTDFLAHETGIELLFESPLRPGEDDFNEETGSKLEFDVASCVFVLIGSSWVSVFADTMLGCSLWELLRFAAQAVRSKVVCATETSVDADTFACLRYLSMSKALCSPTQWLLCTVSKPAVWCGPLQIYKEDKVVLY